MSCEFAIWYEPKTENPAEARKIFDKLSDDSDAVVRPSQKIQEFLDELKGTYPDINDIPIDDADDCPWSCGFEVSAGHVVVSCKWDKVEEVQELLEELTAKHQLVFFDPQNDIVVST